MATENMRFLLRPSSVAIVGCSPIASGKLSSWPLRGLVRHRAPVDIYPVNPRHDVIDGLRCYPSMAALPVTVDLALIIVPAAGVMDAVQAADERGTRAAVVYGASPATERPSLDDRLREYAEHTTMALCGPNTNGIVNVADGIVGGLAPYAQLAEELPRGDVAIVSQSGALISSLVIRLTAAGLGISHSIAVGNAAALGIGDYLRLLADDPHTAVIVVYAEGITDRVGFLSGADTAIAAGKPVIVYKSGRSPSGGAAAVGHTGALTGPYEAFTARCARHRIVVADTLEELAALTVLVRGPLRRGGRVGLVSTSGGVGVILADHACRHGVAVPDFAPDTRDRLAELLRLGSPRNPLDLTGQVMGDPALNREVLAAVAADPGVDHVVFGVQYGPADIQDRLKRDLVALAATGVDVIAYSVQGVDAHREPILGEAGIPVIASADALFAGLAKAVAFGDGARPGPEPAPGDTTRRRAARSLLAATPAGASLPGADAWRLLDLYDVPSVAEHPADDVAEARDIAAGLGYPVAVKLSGLPHRTDHGLVRLDVVDGDGVAEAFTELAERRARLEASDSKIVVQRMAPAGHELILAVRSEPESGPCVLVGFGGVFAEVLDDTVLLAAPANAEQAAAAIGRLRGAPLLDGVRNTAKADRAALTSAVVAMSELAAELDGELAEFEINPLIVTGDRAIAVDALGVHRSR